MYTIWYHVGAKYFAYDTAQQSNPDTKINILSSLEAYLWVFFGKEVTISSQKPIDITIL